MLALSESHLLADRHLDNSLQSGKEVRLLKNELDKTKKELEETKTELVSKVGELDELRKERDSTVEGLQKEVRLC